jgi:hypothetical protein
MRRIGSILALALLVTAAPAAAKGVSSAKVCGVSDCREVEDHGVLGPLSEGGTPSGPPSAGAPWYRVEIMVHARQERDRWSVVAVPNLNKLRGEDGVWMSLSPTAGRAYRNITQGLDAFPASQLGGIEPAKAGGEVPSQRPNEPAADGGPPWGWIGAGTGVALLCLALVLARRRAEGGSPTRPAPAGS